jgi:hypothetical protein
LTVSSIIFGTLLGGMLISPLISGKLLALDLPYVNTGIDSPAEAAMIFITLLYGCAALCNLYIPDTGARYPHQERHPIKLLLEFKHCCSTLWKDKLGQISLAVTTLFWGAGATLQFIVLKWADVSLGLELHQSTYLQGIVAFGVIFGSVLAAVLIPLKHSMRVLWFGIFMGCLACVLGIYDNTFFPGQQLSIELFERTYQLPLYLVIAALILTLIGAFAGFFVVPMNALLQHRGHVLMSAGHSIAVQNFNENLSILFMLALYALLIKLDVSVRIVIFSFGFFIAGSMYLVIRWHRYNQAQYNAEAELEHLNHSH